MSHKTNGSRELFVNTCECVHVCMCVCVCIAVNTYPYNIVDVLTCRHYMCAQICKYGRHGSKIFKFLVATSFPTHICAQQKVRYYKRLADEEILLRGSLHTTDYSTSCLMCTHKLKLNGTDI